MVTMVSCKRTRALLNSYKKLFKKSVDITLSIVKLIQGSFSYCTLNYKGFYWKKYVGLNIICKVAASFHTNSNNN